jgi:uncharacterized protein (TIRG00374 family)
MGKKTARALQWGAGLVGVALFLVLVDTSQLGRLTSARWPGLVGILLATAGLVWSAAARWRLIAVRLAGGAGVPFHRYLNYFLLGRVLGFVFPAEATDVGVRTLALGRTGTFSLAGAAYTVLLDRLLDLVVLAWLVVPALLHLGGWLDRTTAITVGVAGIVITPLVVGRRYRAAFSGAARLCAWFLRLARFLPRVRRIHIPQPEEGTANLDGRTALLVYALGVVKLGMVVARFGFTALALGVSVSPATALIAVPLAQVAALAAVTPGGLGILEAGWYGILVWAGVAREESVLLVVGWRLYTLASLICLLLGLRLWELGWGRRRARPSGGSSGAS